MCRPLFPPKFITTVMTDILNDTRTLLHVLKLLGKITERMYCGFARTVTSRFFAVSSKQWDDAEQGLRTLSLVLQQRDTVTAQHFATDGMTYIFSLLRRPIPTV